MRNKMVAYLCVSCLAFSMNAQNVQKVIIGDNENFGITYSLPKTEIVAKVNAVVKHTIAGVYAPYAEKYLGLEDVCTTDNEEWEIEDITLDFAPVPDKQKTYHILFPEKGALPQFYLSDDAMLLSINRTPAVVKTPLKKTEEENNTKPTLKATDVLNEEILKASSKAKQAELTAKEIFSIRESRRELLRGEIENMPKDGAAMQIVMDRLDAEEQALLSLFIGITTVSKVSKSFSFLPTQNENNRVFFRFSSYFGFVDDDDWVGSPYYISVKILEDKRMNATGTYDDSKKKTAQGIAYCLPGKAHVALSYDDKVIAETDVFMGQFGHVEQLPVSRFTDKKTSASATFNPLTGSIKIYE